MHYFAVHHDSSQQRDALTALPDEKIGKMVGSLLLDDRGTTSWI